jgi:hypothetical protein
VRDVIADMQEGDLAGEFLLAAWEWKYIDPRGAALSVTTSDSAVPR